VVEDLVAGRRVPDRQLATAGDNPRAVGAERHGINAILVASVSQQAEMAEPFDVAPLPATQGCRASVEELLGLGDVIRRPFVLGAVDLIDVELPLEGLGLLLGHPGLALGFVALLLGLVALVAGFDEMRLGLAFRAHRPEGLPGADCRARDQGPGDDEPRRQRRAVAPGELGEPIPA
jgi:hypothetical protein